MGLWLLRNQSEQAEIDRQRSCVGGSKPFRRGQNLHVVLRRAWDIGLQNEQAGPIQRPNPDALAVNARLDRHRPPLLEGLLRSESADT